jgi:toxin ParE1/3/4
MARAILSTRARVDVEEIWQFIAAHRVSAADKQIDRFDQAILLLLEHSGAGQKREDLAPGLRMYPIGNYLILYKPTDFGIEVVRIAHGARDLVKLFED